MNLIREKLNSRNIKLSAAYPKTKEAENNFQLTKKIKKQFSSAGMLRKLFGG
jgi:hypothetical protein